MIEFVYGLVLGCLLGRIVWCLFDYYRCKEVE